MMLMMSFLINFLFLNFNNPLIMGILLITQTILLIMMMGMIYYSFWFSYIMFLVFIGGLFILFIYIISLTYNNKFYMNKNLKYFMIYLSLFIMMNYYNYFIFNYETIYLNIYQIMIKENYFNTIKFYNFPNNMINLLMIFYLLMLLIIVVKITNFKLGPIRTMN